MSGCFGDEIVASASSKIRTPDLEQFLSYVTLL
jgi:hypothetical protein